MEFGVGKVNDIDDAIIVARSANELIMQEEQKLSAYEFNRIVNDIDIELCRFECRWLDKLHLLDYKKAINLLYAEIDRYPSINKYNAGRLDEVEYGVLTDYFNAMGIDGNSWDVIKLEMLMQLSPRKD